MDELLNVLVDVELNCQIHDTHLPETRKQRFSENQLLPLKIGPCLESQMAGG